MHRSVHPIPAARRQRGATTVEQALLVVGAALVAAAAIALLDLNTLLPGAVARVTALLAQ